MHLLSQFFGWPNGAIWGNVVAEPVIAVLTLLVAGKWLRKAIASHRSLHAKVDALHESHQLLHAKLDASPTAPDEASAPEARLPRQGT